MTLKYRSMAYCTRSWTESIHKLPLKYKHKTKDESATIIDVSFPKDDVTLSLSLSPFILLSVVDHEWVGKPKGPPFE